MSHVPLAWDTEFFGFQVARIPEARMGREELLSTVRAMKEEGVRLAYWVSEEKLEDSLQQEIMAFLADERTTYEMDVPHSNAGTLVKPEIIETVKDAMPIGEMEVIAIECGVYSRFSIDPKVPREKFEALFRNWLHESLEKKIADETLVICEGEHVAGLLTMVAKQGKGVIGLIAVKSEYRGKGYGETLVRAAHWWTQSQGLEVAQVVTQGVNKVARNLYEKCGYRLKKVEYSYHFWL